MIAVAGAAAFVAYRARPAVSAPLQKFKLAVQEDGGTIREPAISPDGRRIAYVGRSRILVQSIDEWKPRELVGTEAAVRPFWSPAGDWIAYFRSETLLKVPADGGPVVKVASLPAVQSALGTASGVWGDDGTITVSLAGFLPPMRVPAAGGDVVSLDSVMTPEIADLHALDPLPGGNILVVVHRESGPNAIAVLADGRLRIVLEVPDVDAPAYAPSGHLVYARQSPAAGLWAVPFSVDRLEVTGEPFPIGEGVEPSVARDGTLSFLAGAETLTRQLSWFTMDGRPGSRLAEPREWSEGLAISRDGRRVLAAAADGIWAYDTATGARSRVTSGRTDINPVWVGPNTIAFVRTDNNDPIIVLKELGRDGERTLVRRARFPNATADARRLCFNIDAGPRTPWQVGWIDLDRGTEVHQLAGPHVGARFPSISPDGRLVAYVSGEVGRDEVFLTMLPEGNGKWQISTEGGNWARITPRGDAVVYRAPDGSFMSVPIAIVSGDVTIGQPKKLFDWGAGWKLDYDLAADGQRGIVAMPSGQAMRVPSISIVQHWEHEFTARQR